MVIEDIEKGRFQVDSSHAKNVKAQNFNTKHFDILILYLSCIRKYVTSQHSLAQSQQQKQHNNVSNMFKINCKDNQSDVNDNVLASLLLTLNSLTYCYGVSTM